MKNYVLIIILAFIVPQVQSGEYQLKPELVQDTVLFESDAKLEFIAGLTHSIDGSFTFDIDKPLDSLYGILKVDLNSLKTKIATRDKDMREVYLETDEYPFAYFEILSLENLPEIIKPDSIYSVEGDGYFYLHGVKNKLKPKIKIMVPSSEQNRQIDVTASFHILLEDYEIERPKLVILKVAKQINLQIKFSDYLSENTKKIIIPSIYK